MKRRISIFSAAVLVLLFILPFFLDLLHHRHLLEANHNCQLCDYAHGFSAVHVSVFAVFFTGFIFLFLILYGKNRYEYFQETFFSTRSPPASL